MAPHGIAKLQDLADEIGVTKAAISGVINRANITPDNPTLNKAASRLGVPVRWLLDGTGPAPDWAPPPGAYGPAPSRASLPPGIAHDTPTRLRESGDGYRAEPAPAPAVAEALLAMVAELRAVRSLLELQDARLAATEAALTRLETPQPATGVHRRRRAG